MTGLDGGLDGLDGAQERGELRGFPSFCLEKPSLHTLFFCIIDLQLHEQHYGY